MKMSRMAIGLVEVQGYSVALAVMDQACKAAAITIVGMDCNNPVYERQSLIPVMIQVKFTGTVSDVRVALEAARETAVQLLGESEMSFRLIPSGSEGLEPLLSAGKVRSKS